MNSLDHTEEARRCASFYLGLLEHLGMCYRRDRELQQQALGRFEQERAQIDQARMCMARTRESDAEAARLCQLFGLTAVELINVCIPPPRRIGWYVTALWAARSRGDARAQGRLLGFIGVTLIDRGEYRRALRFFTRQVSVSEQTDDTLSVSDALGNIGLVHKNLGHFDRAVEHYRRQLRLTRKIEDEVGRGRALGNLGVALKHQGRLRLAARLLEKRIRLAHQLPDGRGQANGVMNLGEVLMEMNALPKADKLFQEAMSLFDAVGDRLGIARCKGNIGRVLVRLKMPSKAVRLLQESRRIFFEAGNPVDERRAALHQAEASLLAGDCAGAISAAEAARVSSELMIDQGDEALALGIMSVAHQHTDEEDKARQLKERIVALVKTLDHAKAQVICNKIRSIESELERGQSC